MQVFVETTFRKGVQGLIEEFRSMKRVNDFSLMREFVAQNAFGRNRYKVVILKFSVNIIAIKKSSIWKAETHSISESRRILASLKL